MKKLVLAEKPSVGRDIGKALKCNKSGNGYLEGDKYIVTWALGHLVTLADPEAYGKQYSSWNMEDLPMIPKNLKSVIIKKTRGQFNQVSAQLKRKDVNEIIIGTDAGREGELVARWIIEKSGVKKPIKRLWISSVTEKAIKEGFNNLKEGKQYENLYKSALSRAEADWYVGINATRALTCKYNAQLSCGRVQTPTLFMVKKREDEITKFKSEKYYGLEGEYSGIKFQWIDEKNNSRLFDKGKIEEKHKKLNNKTFVIDKIEKKKKTMSPPKLYDLTELQKDGSRLYNFSGKETLSIIQSLYERHKVLTYPRTDSSYISSDMIDTLKDRVKACSIEGYSRYSLSILKSGIKTNKSFVDNSKVTDHHAIIPTEEKANLRDLNDKEIKIYELVVRRFLGVFLPKYEYEETNIKLSLEKEKLCGKTKLVLNKGWKDLYNDSEIVEKKNINIKEKDEIKLKLNITEGETSPPSRFTEGTILGAMENPIKYMETGDKNLLSTIDKTGGIGTVATRADIIEKLFNSFLIEKIGNEIHITSKGKQLLELVPEDLKSPILTAEWELKLEKISKGQLDKNTFLRDILNYTKKTVEEIKASEDKFRHDNLSTTKCPDCGKVMLEVNGKKGKMLVCQDRECGNRKMISKVTNARCPECKKKLDLRGSGDSAMFACKCGYREKLSSFNKRKAESKSKISKKEVNSYLKKQKDEEINNPFADLLSGLKIK